MKHLLQQYSFMDSRKIRTCLLYEYNLGTTIDETYRRMCLAFGANSISIKSIRYWYNRFKRGDQTIEQQSSKTNGLQKKLNEIEILSSKNKNESKIESAKLTRIFNEKNSLMYQCLPRSRNCKHHIKRKSSGQNILDKRVTISSSNNEMMAKKSNTTSKRPIIKNSIYQDLKRILNQKLSMSIIKNGIIVNK